MFLNSRGEIENCCKQVDFKRLQFGIWEGIVANNPYLYFIPHLYGCLNNRKNAFLKLSKNKVNL